MQCPVGTIPLNLDSKQELCGTQVTKLELLGQIFLDLADGLLRLGNQIEMVNENRNDDLHSILLIHPDAVITFDLDKAHTTQDLVQLDVPNATGLL